MFLFLDTENSGLNREFSQILEIAMITTDSDLNLMSSLHHKCKKLPWDVPSPGALLITGITPEQLKKESLCHYDMMGKVNDYVHNQNWPVIFSGYNIHGYDLGVISQNLHQTLHDPFIMTARRHWQAEANCVFDILELVKAVHVYAPKVLKLNIKTPTGLPSMALGNVCRQNGINLSEADAHGALADTKATIDLARKLKKDAPDIWAQMVKMANRNNVDKFLEENRVFAYTQSPYGKASTLIGTKLAVAKGSKTEVILWDLNEDPQDYLSKSDDELVAIFKLWGKARQENPVQTLQTHKQPILMPADAAQHLRPKELSDDKIAARLKTLDDNPKFAVRLAEAAQKARGTFTHGAEPEQQIYSFPDSQISRDLADWKKAFHAGDWDKKIELMIEFKTRFARDMQKDPALKRFMIFAQRIVYANAGDKISDEQRDKIDLAVHARRSNPDEKAPYMTIARARKELAEIEEQRAEGDEKWQHVTDSQIRALKLFYTSLEKEFDHLADTAGQKKTGVKPRPPGL